MQRKSTKGHQSETNHKENFKKSFIFNCMDRSICIPLTKHNRGQSLQKLSRQTLDEQTRWRVHAWLSTSTSDDKQLDRKKPGVGDSCYLRA